MDVLLSIRPEYTEKLFSGEKRYEFRKCKPREKIEKVFIYESRGSRKIVGWFTIRSVHSGSPEEIWEKCKDRGGIQKTRYLAYCNGRHIIYAFEIDRIVRFDQPVNPSTIIPNFKPPQNFVYVSAQVARTTSDENTNLGLCPNSD
jgi:predicted transcriptional regulator